MKLDFTQACYLVVAFLCFGTLKSFAVVTAVFQDETNQPGFTTQDYRFTAFSKDSYPTYEGSYPYTNAWPSPIQADGGGTAESLNKVSGSTDFLALSGYGGGIYHAGAEATYAISNSAPLADANSLIYQIYIAKGVDAAATNNEYVGLPSLVLTLSDGSHVTIPSSAGTVLSSNPTVINGNTTSLDDVSFNFNLSSVDEPITSYALDTTFASHSILYGMDVTESTASAAPEPGRMALMFVAFGAVICRRRRKLPYSATGL